MQHPQEQGVEPVKLASGHRESLRIEHVLEPVHVASDVRDCAIGEVGAGGTQHAGPRDAPPIRGRRTERGPIFHGQAPERVGIERAGKHARVPDDRDGLHQGRGGDGAGWVLGRRCTSMLVSSATRAPLSSWNATLDVVRSAVDTPPVSSARTRPCTGPRV